VWVQIPPSALERDNIFLQNNIMEKKAFTLIELFLSAVIISLLVSIALLNYSQYRKSARDAKGIEEIKSIAKALELKYNDLMQYPDLPDSEEQILPGDTRLLPYLKEVPTNNGARSYFWLDGGTRERYCVYFQLERADNTYFTCSQGGCQKCQTVSFSPTICCLRW
jgi:type II secretory pathway pseudopilin PulG